MGDPAWRAGCSPVSAAYSARGASRTPRLRRLWLKLPDHAGAAAYAVEVGADVDNGQCAIIRVRARGPSEFIPVLEETGLIHQVGAWALQRAMKDFRRWRDSGLRAVPISVNVSFIQLRRRSFVEEVAQLVGSGLNAADGLELEITESVMMSSVMQTIDTLRAVRGLGVKIAIDDFGTGFSSLNYLSRLPVDILKIDRSFVNDMTTGPQGIAVVTTIIALAKSLRLKLVAEGVETEEQARLLTEHGCDEMQGFLFSRDLPVDLFEAKFLRDEAPA